MSCSKYVPVDGVGAIEDVFGRLCRVSKVNPLQVLRGYRVLPVLR